MKCFHTRKDNLFLALIRGTSNPPIWQQETIFLTWTKHTVHTGVLFSISVKRLLAKSNKTTHWQHEVIICSSSPSLGCSFFNEWGIPQQETEANFIAEAQERRPVYRAKWICRILSSPHNFWHPRRISFDLALAKEVIPRTIRLKPCCHR